MPTFDPSGYQSFSPTASFTQQPQQQSQLPQQQSAPQTYAPQQQLQQYATQQSAQAYRPMVSPSLSLMPQMSYGGPSAGAPQQASPGASMSFSPQLAQSPYSQVGSNATQGTWAGPQGYQIPSWARASTSYGQGWQPTWGQPQSPYAQAIPSLMVQQRQAAGPSVNQLGLSGNPQGVADYIQALRSVGAGGNNNQMAQQQAPQQQASPLFSQLAGSNGQGSQYGYNAGFGAQGGGMNFGELQASQNAQQTGAQASQLAQSSGMFAPKAQLSPMMSDERTKTSVAPAKRDLRAFLGALGAHAYEYKDPEAHGEGRYVSPMAQELAKTKLGREGVVTTKGGLMMVDYGRLSGTMLAAQADLHHRLKKLEGKKR